MVSTVLCARSKKRLLLSKISSVVLIAAALAGCQGGGESGPLDSPARGEIVIAVDESFRPLVQAEIDVYHSIYPYTTINAEWKPEALAIQSLLNGEVRLAVVSRELNDQEKAVFEQQKITPRSLKIAEDGVALIINRNNPDSLITMQQLQRIFDGEVTTWSDLRPGANPGEILIVFDNNGSSNLNFIFDKFGVEDLEHLNAFATQSNQEVIEYVQTNENAIGIIGTNWISDTDDPSAQSFLDSIRVMGIAVVPNPSPGDYYQPYQAYLSLDTYPLERNVYILSREARSGLGSGFMTHVASDRGQRVVLKSGLLPATMPVRLVGITDSF
jgi:phosphate transport system substrate-binding protein